MPEEKAFAPTATRLRKARQDGNIPQAAELLSLVAFSAGWFTLEQLSMQVAVSVATVLRETPSFVAHHILEDGNAVQRLGEVWIHPASEIVGILVAIMSMSILLTLVSAKVIGSIGWKTPSLQWSRLSPGQNLKRIISLDTILATVRALLITLLIVTTMIFGLVHCASAMLGTLSLKQTAVLAQAEFSHSVRSILLCGGFFAFFEARTALAQWARKLRMDYSELKREYREQSGDPHQQSQRKRRHRRMLRSRKTEVQGATLIVTNPTHIAIALLYHPPEVGVPIIVARAADLAAAQVRAIAQRAGVPIIEAISVARMLYATGEEGSAIPLEAYMLVAPLVAKVLAKG